MKPEIKCAKAEGHKDGYVLSVKIGDNEYNVWFTDKPVDASKLLYEMVVFKELGLSPMDCLNTVQDFLDFLDERK